MPNAINGTGMMWYGRVEPLDDGSTVLTEWITVLWLPPIPLGSKRVKWIDSTVPWWKYKPLAEEYRVAKVDLHIPHVLKGYAVTSAVVTIIGFGLVIG